MKHAEIECKVRQGKRTKLIATLCALLNAQAVDIDVENTVVGNVSVNADGTVSFRSAVPDEDIHTLYQQLCAAGFAGALHTSEPLTCARIAPEPPKPKRIPRFTGKVYNPPVLPPQPQDLRVKITIPRVTLTDAEIQKLRKLLEARGSLIKKALNIDDLTIEVSDTVISFPWINDAYVDGNHVTACTVFVSKLCDYVQTINRVFNYNDVQYSNEKYEMRTFLNRIGFVGEKYKVERKMLLERLDGDPAYQKLESRKGMHRHKQP